MTYRQYFEKTIISLEYRAGILEGKNRIKREFLTTVNTISEEFSSEDSKQIVKIFLDIFKEDWLLFQVEIQNLRQDISSLETFKENMLKNKLTYKKYKG